MVELELETTVEVSLWGAQGLRGWARVSMEDVAQAAHRWNVADNGYVQRTIPGIPRRNVRLHREVMGLVRGDGREVDHRNGVRVDCRRSNLRVVTRGQNTQNVPSRGGASAFRGVSSMPSGRWRAIVTVRGRQHRGGTWDTEEQAATAARELRARLMTHAEEARS